MLSVCRLVFLLLILLAHRAPAKLSPADASFSNRWLRLYQFDRTRRGFKCAVTSPDFFFSEQGRTRPDLEMAAAIKAFSSPELLFGLQRQPAACVFPARLHVLEDLLDVHFPKPPCSDLDNWVKRIDADQAHLVFVGAYPGNPASILGHSFVRLSHSKRTGRDGVDLLSYSVGFLAQADPRDNRLMYMWHGVTGAYPGYYEIEPHYMKVGLYNNSESRDLWDLDLKLTREQTELLVLHLWELTFNARMDYYFIGHNCSYRLVRLIEAVRDDVDISSKLPAVVLPAETVRELVRVGILYPDARFRPSIKRQMTAKLSNLDQKSRHQFELARSSVDQLRQTQDPLVVDALLDYWLFENYKAETKLSADQRRLMEATYQQARQLEPFPEAPKPERIKAPYEGHPPRWIEGFAGAGTLGLKYRTGVHPFWSGDPAYEGIAAIEYLGAGVSWSDARWYWDLTLIEARSLQWPAWMFSAQASNECWLCDGGRGQLQMAGGVGLSRIISGGSSAYLFFHTKTAAWIQVGLRGLIAPGVVAGLRWNRLPFTWLIEGSHHKWQAKGETELSTRLNYAWSRQLDFFFQARRLQHSPIGSSAEAVLGSSLFF